MKEAIRTYLNSIKILCPKMTQGELEYLESRLTVTELKSKHFYIHADTIQKEIGFVYYGLLRSFYVDNNGKEITVNFIKENSFATHYTSFITQKPAKYNFQCLEPTVIVNLSYSHIQEGYERFPNIERYGRLVAEEVLKMQQRRIESFLFDNAEKRYSDFVKYYPDLFNRVSISYLSSYLGIERQSLTRIRKKLTYN